MIVSFRHKGLRKFFETGSLAGIQPGHAARLHLLLNTLEVAHVIDDMNKSGYHLHSLRGLSTPRWAVEVNANRRLTFEFDCGDAHVLDYEDYH